MSKIWLPFIYLVLLCCSSDSVWAVLQNNISVSGISSPLANERRALATPMVVSAAAVNAGTNNQTNVKVMAVITHPDYGVLYRDTATVPNWTSNVVLTMTFKSFTPYVRGEYRLCVIADLASDEQRSDDTLCHSFFGVYDVDLRATSVTYPLSTDTIRERSEFRVRGTFENVGLADQYDVKLRVQIRRCSDNALFFQADSTVEELYIDSLPREFRFPSRHGNYDIRFLDAGCYRVAVIAMHPFDANSNNDTAYRTITVAPNDNNIRADSAIAPPAGSYVTSPQTLPVSVRFKNTGLNEQTNVSVTVTVRHNNGNVIMRDTAIFNDWKYGEYRIADFDSFATPIRGMYTITAISHLANDEWRVDDTLRYSIFYNFQNDIRVVAITDPLANEKKTLGTTFEPTATFIPELSITKQFTNVPAKVVIRRCVDNAIVFTADSLIPFLHYDSGAIPFRFPSQEGTMAIGNLEIGCYRMAVIVDLAIDSNRTNDTLYRTFSIIDPTLLKNITVDSILFPANGAIIPIDSTSIPVAARYTNTGQSGESLVQALVFARNQDDSIVYSDVRFFALASLETRDITFANFTPQGLGVFRIYAMSVLSGDTRSSDDTVVHKIFRGYANDVAAVAVTKPTPGEEIEEGTAFTPAGTFRWQGGFGSKNNIPVRMDIRKCGDTTVVFYSETMISGLSGDMGKKTQTFPSQNGAMDVRDLEVGCYTATISAMLVDDTFDSNDIASITFSIIPEASVDGAEQVAVELANNYPNPASTVTTFQFKLPEAGVVSLQLTDMLGNSHPIVVAEYFAAGSHLLTADLRDLAAGVYRFELRFSGPNGRAARVAKTMSIVR